MKHAKILIIIGLVGLLILQIRCSNQKIELFKNINETMNDSLKVYKNDKGQNVSSISINEINRLKGLTDSLKKEVKKLKKLRNVTVIKTTTEKIVAGETIVEHDTVYIDSIEIIKPVYLTSWNNDWSKGSVKATSDSIKVNYTEYNKFRFTLQDKRGVIRKKPSTITVVNENPNTVTTGIKSYTFKPKQKLISVGVQTGYGITPKGFQPYAGLGIQINIK